MRPDVARSARSFSPPYCWTALRLDADSQSAMRCALDSADSQFSDSGAAFLPRSGVLSRHDTIVLVIPRDYRRRRASPRGWRDRCRSQGHGPSGRRSWQPMRAVAPRKFNSTPDRPACRGGQLSRSKAAACASAIEANSSFSGMDKSVAGCLIAACSGGFTIGVSTRPTSHTHCGSWRR